MAPDHDDDVLRRRGWLPGQVPPEEAAELVRRNARDDADRRRWQAPTHWTEQHVFARLVEAMGVLRRTPARIWPKQYGNAMPSVVYDADDMRGQAEMYERSVSGRSIRRYGSEIITTERNRVRLQPKSDEITRANEALAWCLQFLHDKPEYARAVQLAALWHLSGANIGEECRRRGLSRSAFYKRSAQALVFIKARLVAEGVVVK